MATYDGNRRLGEILEWILAHRKDSAAMDRISRAVYPYTTHYLNKLMAEVENEKKDS